MNILEDQNLVMNGMTAKMMQHSHPMHRDKFDEEYETLRAVYYPIKQVYQEFFKEFCGYEDVDMANKKAEEELQNKKALITPLPIFTCIEDLKESYGYVAKLKYPASYEEMSAFLRRVFVGDMKFLNQYPDNNDVKSLDRIKTIKIHLL